MTQTNRSQTLVVMNDTHCTIRSCGVYFESSTFHNFLQYFTKFKVILSSPCLNFPLSETNRSYFLENVRIIRRRGYGTASQFYRALPAMIVRSAIDAISHIRQGDIVMLVLPACTAPISYVAARLLRKPIVLYVVGDVSEVVETSGTYKGVAAFAARMAAHWEAAFIRFAARRCLTFTLGSRLKQKLEAAGAIPHPAMTSLVRERDIRSPRPQEPLKTIRLVSVGRLSGEKGFDLAVRVVASLVADGANLRYTIVGEGPSRAYIEGLVRSTGISERVKFTGRLSLDEIKETIYPRSDIFLLPSYSEGVPKVVLEAMAAGVPVIATSVGGVPEMVGQSQERGWLICPNDAQGLRAAILDCALNPNLRAARVRAAHDFAMQHTTEAEAGRIEGAILGACCRRFASG